MTLMTYNDAKKLYLPTQKFVTLRSVSSKVISKPNRIEKLNQTENLILE